MMTCSGEKDRADAPRCGVLAGVGVANIWVFGPRQIKHKYFISNHNNSDSFATTTSFDSFSALA